MEVESRASSGREESSIAKEKLDPNKQNPNDDVDESGWDSAAVYATQSRMVVYLTSLKAAEGEPLDGKAISIFPAPGCWFQERFPRDMSFAVVGSKLYGFGGHYIRHYGDPVGDALTEYDIAEVLYPRGILVCDLKQVCDGDKIRVEKRSELRLNEAKPHPIVVPYKNDKIFIFTSGIADPYPAIEVSPCEVLYLSDHRVETLLNPIQRKTTKLGFPIYRGHLVVESRVYFYVDASPEPYSGSDQCLYCFDMETLEWCAYENEVEDEPSLSLFYKEEEKDSKEVELGVEAGSSPHEGDSEQMKKRLAERVESSSSVSNKEGSSSGSIFPYRNKDNVSVETSLGWSPEIDKEKEMQMGHIAEEMKTCSWSYKEGSSSSGSIIPWSYQEMMERLAEGRWSLGEGCSSDSTLPISTRMLVIGSSDSDSDSESDSEYDSEEYDQVPCPRYSTCSCALPYASCLVKDICNRSLETSFSWIHNGKHFELFRHYEGIPCLSVEDLAGGGLLGSDIPHNAMTPFLKEDGFVISNGLIARVDKNKPDVFCLFLGCDIQGTESGFIKFCTFQLVADSRAPRYDFKILAQLDRSCDFTRPGLLKSIFTPDAHSVYSIEITNRLDPYCKCA